MRREQSGHPARYKLNEPQGEPGALRVLRPDRVDTQDWRSYSGETASKSREEFINQVKGFGKMIPDLAWSIKARHALNTNQNPKIAAWIS